MGAIERTMIRMKKVLFSPPAKDKAAAEKDKAAAAAEKDKAAADKDKAAAPADKDKAAAPADKDKAAAPAAKTNAAAAADKDKAAAPARFGGSTTQDKAAAAEKGKAAAAEKDKAAAAETEESAAAASATITIALHERFKNTRIELVQPRHIIQDEVLFRDNCAYTSNIACIRLVRIRAILLIYMNTHRLVTMCVYAQYCTYTNVSYTHANARTQTCCNYVTLCLYTCNIVCRRAHCIHAHMRVYKLVV